MAETYPLDGVRVVALEQAVAAPLCTRHLADLGAEVTKIERPDGGDFARSYDSVVLGESAHFVWLNRGKRSVVLDLAAEAGRAALGARLEQADVFVHNLGPGAVDRLGFGREAVRTRWPRLVNCMISGYGSDGPYRDRKAFDLLLQGESGLISVTGTPDAAAKVGISVADISAGVYGFSAILAALLAREKSQRGAFIDISMLECLAEWMAVPMAYAMYGGGAPKRAGARHNMIVPYGPYRTGRGGAVNLAVQNEAQWRRFCEQVLERPELVDDDRLRTNELRVRNRAVLEPLIESCFVDDDVAAVERKLVAADVPFGRLNSVEDVVRHPQLAARGRWIDVATPRGTVRAVDHPLNIEGMPRRHDAVPSLGEQE